jgi:hypothetical protein
MADDFDVSSLDPSEVHNPRAAGQCDGLLQVSQGLRAADHLLLLITPQRPQIYPRKLNDPYGKDGRYRSASHCAVWPQHDTLSTELGGAGL